MILREIVLKRKLSLENEKKENILKKLIDLVDENIEKKRKLRLSKFIKYCKYNPIIAEIKPASPSKGNIRNINDVGEIAREIERGGAIGLSVLTEKDYFNGSYENLILARKAVSIPILMKDFIIDKYQLDIAHTIGANAVLLIVRVLKDELGKFLDYADDLGLECLVETHSEDEIDLALDFGAKIIGINNRDLSTLKIDLSTTEKLSQLIPKNKIKIGESGIYTKEDLKYILKFTDAALIGSSIMESENIEEKVKEFVYC
ncbi:indole-3-glycerol phosphate synthase TrpC [Methanocaldococcus indicus]|uniref:indole-3-glycerol phosphate synthase TrpC n=1 Tax=Methanocaldococcus indicus TaxID=213231 RepID=UPI003C6CE6A4